MNKLLTNCWIVGDVKWKENLAHVAIANSKTAARQVAERYLAYAYWTWNKDGEREAAFWLKHCNGKYKTVKELAQACNTKKWSCSSSYMFKQYQLIQDGVWIRSIANGECLHITEPSKKAILERARLEKQSAAWADNMIKGLLASFKKK